MKIFVTGAAGFVGSRLSLALVQRGDEVIGFDNFDPYYNSDLKQLHLQDLQNEARFSFVQGDLRDTKLVREIFERENFDGVAHVAAMAAVRYSVQNPLVYGEVNVQGTSNILDAARHTSKPICVMASTGSVYGRDTPIPFDEDAPAIMPLAPYPASKRAMELFAYTFAHNYGLKTTVLRFFNVYGPHGRPDMMPWQWATKISRGEEITLFNGGRMKRDWTYIDDIVSGFIAALDRPKSFEIINLGCGRPVENLRFVQILEELVGKQARIIEAPVPDSEPIETFAKIEKAKRLLDWEPQTNVEEGLANFINWLRENKLLVS